MKFRPPSWLTSISPTPAKRSQLSDGAAPRKQISGEAPWWIDCWEPRSMVKGTAEEIEKSLQCHVPGWPFVALVGL
jgi:hypothetical protein